MQLGHLWATKLALCLAFSQNRSIYDSLKQRPSFQPSKRIERSAGKCAVKRIVPVGAFLSAISVHAVFQISFNGRRPYMSSCLNYLTRARVNLKNNMIIINVI